MYIDYVVCLDFDFVHSFFVLLNTMYCVVVHVRNCVVAVSMEYSNRTS